MSGRYQSKVLSYLSQQSLRWRDRLAKTVRQATQTVVWSSQILLYPIYVAFQSTRLADRQLRQTVRQAAPRLQAVRQVIERIVKPTQARTTPKADTPIQRTLQAIRWFALPDGVLPDGVLPDAALPNAALPNPDQPKAESPNLATLATGDRPASADSSQPDALTLTRSRSAALVKTQPAIASPGEIPLTVVGLASMLDSQRIALVAANNHVLDILTTAQQRSLRQRMAWELADYWRQRRILAAARKPVLPFLPPPAPRSNALPPVNLFRQTMAWVQISPVAIATNLFQESALLSYLQQRHPPTADGESPPAESLPRLRSPRPLSLKAPRLALPPWLSQSALTRRDQGAIAPAPATAVSPAGSTALTSSAVSSVALERVSPDGGRSLDYEPTYIETQATVVGYDVHPLERVLKWLDLLLLWLERQLQSMSQWWRDRP